MRDHSKTPVTLSDDSANPHGVRIKGKASVSITNLSGSTINVNVRHRETKKDGSNVFCTLAGYDSPVEIADSETAQLDAVVFGVDNVALYTDEAGNHETLIHVVE